MGFEPITSCIVCGIAYHCTTSVKTLVMCNVQRAYIYIVNAHGDWYIFANGMGAYCVIRVRIEYVHVCTCMYRYVQVHTRVYRHITACTGTYRYILVHTSMYMYVQVHTGMYLYIRVYTGMYRYIQLCTGMY